MSPPKIDFVVKARAAWGDKLPAEVLAFAEMANANTLAIAGQRIGYSPATASYIISNAYKGDVARVFAKIRGGLMSETVMCPVVGEIGTDRCIDEQKMGNTGASSIRALLFKNCRGIGAPKCRHSRIQTPTEPDLNGGPWKTHRERARLSQKPEADDDAGN